MSCPYPRCLWFTFADFYTLSVYDWVGVKVCDGVLIARYYAGIFQGFSEKRYNLIDARCIVSLVHGGDLWPSKRIYGVNVPGGLAYGLFRSRNGTSYYALSLDCDSVGVYLEVNGLRLFVCGPRGKVLEFYNAAKRYCGG